MHLQAGTSSFQFSPLTFIDTTLYGAFEENDIRKYLYFTAPDEEGRVNFVGNFSGSFQVFTGLTTGELHLSKAECQARLGRVEEAIITLNRFLESRYFVGSFIPYEASGSKEVLSKVLMERRKELIYRGLGRWADMRRLLGDADWTGSQVRTIDGIDYKVGTDPLEYIIDIPRNEKKLNGKL